MNYRENMKVHFRSRESSLPFTTTEDDISCHYWCARGNRHNVWLPEYNLVPLQQVFPSLVISLKALRSPIQPCAMTLSILNNTNKSNYRKYEYGELLIFMKIFLYKTAYEGGISGWKPPDSSCITSKHKILGKKERRKFFRFIPPVGEFCLVLPRAGCADTGWVDLTLTSQLGLKI